MFTEVYYDSVQCGPPSEMSELFFFYRKRFPLRKVLFSFVLDSFSFLNLSLLINSAWNMTWMKVDNLLHQIISSNAILRTLAETFSLTKVVAYKVVLKTAVHLTICGAISRIFFELLHLWRSLDELKVIKTSTVWSVYTHAISWK